MEDNIYKNIMFILQNLELKGLEIKQKSKNYFQIKKQMLLKRQMILCNGKEMNGNDTKAREKNKTS